MYEDDTLVGEIAERLVVSPSCSIAAAGGGGKGIRFVRDPH